MAADGSSQALVAGGAPQALQPPAAEDTLMASSPPRIEAHRATGSRSLRVGRASIRSETATSVTIVEQGAALRRAVQPRSPEKQYLENELEAMSHKMQWVEQSAMEMIGNERQAFEQAAAMHNERFEGARNQFEDMADST